MTTTGNSKASACGTGLHGALAKVSNRDILIAPSLLAADFARLSSEVTDVSSAGAEVLHLDIMDGHFVPNISFGPGVVKSLRGLTGMLFDVHLMLSEPGRYVDAFLAAGADIITLHVESNGDLGSLLQAIHAAGRSAGVVLRPGTSVRAVYPYLELVDMVLVMTVEPGFGGQSFMAGQVRKLSELREAIGRCGRPVHLEVDGGIGAATAPQVLAAGANILVAGSSVFGCRGTRAEAIAQLRRRPSPAQD